MNCLGLEVEAMKELYFFNIGCEPEFMYTTVWHILKDGIIITGVREFHDALEGRSRIV